MDHEHSVQNLAVERYLLHEMTPADRESFEEHYFECETCASAVRDATQFVEDAKDVWSTERRRRVTPVSAPSHGNWFQWFTPKFAVPAMAAMLLAVTVTAFSNRTLSGQLEEAAAPHVVTSIALPPETRGTPTPVRAASGSEVLLEFDLPTAPTSRLQYVIRSAEDQVVLEPIVDERKTEGRVVVSIPRFTLNPGRYALVVETTDTKSELARFSFEVTRP